MEHRNVRDCSPVFQRYEFPVLADDSPSVSRSKTDPLACNINNDAVLIWNDVIFRPCDALPRVSLSSGTSIEEVFRELQTTAEDHLWNANNSKNGGCGKNILSNNGEIKDRDVSHLGNKNDIVERRRLYEKGSDLELMSLHGNGRTEHGSARRLNTRALHPGNYECPYPLTYRDIGGENCSLTSGNCRENDSSNRVVLQNDAHGEEQNDKGYDDAQCDKGYYDAQCDKGYSEDMEELFQWAPPVTIPSQNDPDVFTVTAVCDSSTDKSRFDSGHFEDMSLDVSNFDNGFTPPAVDCDAENQTKYHEQIMFDDDSGEIEKVNEELFSGNGEEKLERGCEYFDLEEDSEVFIQNEDCTDKTRHLESLNTKLSSSRVYPESEIPWRNRSHRSRNQDLAWRRDNFIMVRCENQSCGKVLSLPEARKSYKNCHHCLRTYYCSRECRRQDWDRHKESGLCHGSLVSSACKKVIRYCNSDREVKGVLSRLAIRGYLSHGRGCVMLGFPDLECTHKFMEFGFPVIELNPIYVSAKELSESKMYGNMLENLLEVCRSYRPDVKFVLNVGVGLRFNKTDYLDSIRYQHCYCLHNHSNDQIVHRSGSQGIDLGYGSLSNSVNNVSKDSVSSPTRNNSFSHCHHSNNSRNSSSRLSFSKHKGPILQKFIKLKLTPVHSQEKHEKRLTFEEHFWDKFRTSGPTLVLTSVPECSSVESESKKRELTFTNIQRKLRQRNVNLRQQYPSVYANLIEYVVRGVRFPSQILFPMDTKTGRTFTCFMMPEVEAEPEWMQSHYLLNDLRLSKDSLERSMSRSLASSMLSLVSSTSHNRSNMSLNSTPEKMIKSKHNDIIKQRSNSLSCLDSVQGANNYIEKNYIEKTPKPFKLSSPCHLDHSQQSSSSSYHNLPPSSLPSIENHTKDSNPTSSYVSTTNKPLLESHNHNNNTTTSTVPSSVWLNPPPGEISTDHQTINSNIMNDNNIDSNVNNNNNLNFEFVIPGKECHLTAKVVRSLDSTDQAAPSPRYYPVRKARNVKLCANSNLHSLPGNPKLQPHQLQQHTVHLSPSDASKSSPSSFLLTPSSPALYASTPLTKTAETHTFEQRIPPTTTTSSPSSSPQFTPTTAPQLSPIKKTPGDSILPILFDYEMDRTLRPQYNQSKHPNSHGYSNDSSPDCNGGVFTDGGSGGVVVCCCARGTEYGFDSCYRNEVVVDEVDRMKCRRKDRRSKSKAATTPDSEYCLFVESTTTTLDSPPLATSTLLRDCGCGRFESHEVSRNHRRKKQKRSGSVDVITADKTVSNTSNFKNTNENGGVELANRGKGNNQSNGISLDYKTDNDERYLKSIQNQQNKIFTSMGQLPPTDRRKFNTNSPLFPKNSTQLTLPSPNILIQTDGGDGDGHGDMKCDPENSEVHGRLAKFENDQDNCIITSSRNNRCKSITRPPSCGTHTEIISNTIIHSLPSSSLHKSTTNIHNRDVPSKHPRDYPQVKCPVLRTRVFNDVTHPSSNQMAEEFSKSGSRTNHRKLKPRHIAKTTTTTPFSHNREEDNRVSRRNRHSGYDNINNNNIGDPSSTNYAENHDDIENNNNDSLLSSPLNSGGNDDNVKTTPLFQEKVTTNHKNHRPPRAAVKISYSSDW